MIGKGKKRNEKAGIPMRKTGIITSSEAKAVNFREICMGNIAPYKLYRSSHPIKNNEQEKIISILAEQAQIAAVINLSDNNHEITQKAVFAPWYDKLLKTTASLPLV